MEVEIKKKILDLLDKDIEFRYAIAGYLGLSEIIKGQEKIWENLNRIWENLNRLWENQNKLWEEIRALREDQKKLWENQNKLWENQNKLLENQNKLWEEVRALREGQDKLWENQNKLWENQNRIWEEIKTLREREEKLWENVNKLWEEVKALREDTNKLWEETKKLREESNMLRKEFQEGYARLLRHLDALGSRWGIMSEEAFREGIRGLLSKELGFAVEKWEYLDKEGYVYGHEAPIDIDIAISNTKVIAIEISSHVKASDVQILKRKVELYEKVTGKKVSRLIFVTPFIDDKAKRLCIHFGIEVYTSI